MPDQSSSDPSDLDVARWGGYPFNREVNAAETSRAGLYIQEPTAVASSAADYG